MALKLKSRSFTANEKIPARYTIDDAAINPSFVWSGVPERTRELALVCEDLDAPKPLPDPLTHWLVWGISPNASLLPEGLPPEPELRLPVMIRQGTNSFMRVGYLPPSPPRWDHPHRYRFTLFALDQPIALPEGAGREEFFKAVGPHVIDKAELTGTYERRHAERVRRLLSWGKLAAPMALLAGAVVYLKSSGARRERFDERPAA